jgi:hypothetical protein
MHEEMSSRRDEPVRVAKSMGKFWGWPARSTNEKIFQCDIENL